ncbi:uncharacterized protein LOC128875644 [Hylaeus volcanicus]|uniref:uncharacterized protein LOC128875644 n=1 Tax=Hylaeus volcanicus TaxID=313075 RepID=UPI0023B82BB0|nr:uncharacterized protein LOC128875644 [Hylaeus volcanicus]
MRSVVFVALIIACAFALLVENAYANTSTTTTPKQVKEPKEIKETATASKDLKDAVKAAKEAKKNKKDCLKECGTEYEPICVHDPNDANYKPRTFGSQCALDVHNCEMGTKLAVKDKGKCPGTENERLG